MSTNNNLKIRSADASDVIRGMSIGDMRDIVARAYLNPRPPLTLVTNSVAYANNQDLQQALVSELQITPAGAATTQSISFGSDAAAEANRILSALNITSSNQTRVLKLSLTAPLFAGSIVVLGSANSSSTWVNQALGSAAVSASAQIWSQGASAAASSNQVRILVSGNALGASSATATFRVATNSLNQAVA